MNTKKYSPDKVIKALQDAQGIKIQAAKLIGCDRSTLERYITDNDEIRQAYEDARESLVDTAESKLLANIEKGDVASIIFCLKCLGKDRGYVERWEINDNKRLSFSGDPLGLINGIITQINTGKPELQIKSFKSGEKELPASSGD